MKQHHGPVSDTEASSVRNPRECDNVGRLASRIAHDFSNLLTILLGYAEWLETREGVDPQFAEVAREIRQVSMSASVLARQLLAFSRHESGLRAWATDAGGADTATATAAAVADRAHDTDETPPMLRTAGGDEWILVVEDDARLRSLAEQILATRGYHAVSAAHGKEALAQIEKHRAKLSLLLTDVVLPDTNGRELASRALKACPSLSVIYMSGYTDEGALHCSGDTSQAFLGKPFTAVGLLELVRSTLDAARARART